MKPHCRFHQLNRLSVPILFFCAIASASVLPTRLDLFDASDNNLMFITFEYEGDRNVSRTVYMSDSTFVRRVMVNRGADGTRTNEVSFNFDDDTSFVTSYQYSGAATQVKIVDQFKVDQVGGTVNYATAGGTNYDLTFSKTGAVAAKMTYEKNDDGSLRKVTVLDKSGQLQYYGVFASGAAVSRPNLRSAQKGAQALVKPRGARQLELQMNLPVAGEVRCELITLAGRSAGVLFAGAVKAGPQNRLLSFDGKNQRRIADGVYMLSVSVDGATVLRSRYLHQSSAIGGGR
jgi:hypothetical protein